MSVIDIPALSFNDADEEEWDRLWIMYFKKEPQQLVPQSEVRLKKLPRNRDGMIRDEILFVGCDPSAVEGKTVMELGCGCGFLAKRIAHFTKLYIGLDWSGMALLVAKRTCPENTLWVHPRETERLRELAGDVDSFVFRHFMIHQDFAHARNLLEFCLAMLKGGGSVYADFWLDGPAGDAGRIFAAKAEPGTRPRNAAYRFTDDEITELASLTGFEITDSLKRPDKLRQFVTLTKPGA